jgi:hypothetical protein
LWGAGHSFYWNSDTPHALQVWWWGAFHSLPLTSWMSKITMEQYGKRSGSQWMNKGNRVERRVNK